MDNSSDATTVAEVANATMSEAVDAVRDQFGSMLIAIRRSPLQAVAIAASAGFVAALLVRH